MAVVAFFRLELDKSTIKKYIGDNPEFIICKVYNPIFKLGYLDLEIPEKLLNWDGLKIKVDIPKEFLIENAKPCKIGSYQLKKPPTGKLAKNKVLKFLATKYTTIDLFVA